jgi:tripeptidyl-peptidase I
MRLLLEMKLLSTLNGLWLLVLIFQPPFGLLEPDISWSGASSSSLRLRVSLIGLICSTSHVLLAPLVNSVSYGGNEANSPVDYRRRVDQEFQKLAAIGVSIVVSSGDAGATNVGHGSESCEQLLPQYPAASPFVTSVSATFFTPAEIPMCSISYFGKPVHCSDYRIGEVAVSADIGMDWTTGGGFSSSVPRPSWQDTAVNTYLSQHSSLLPPSSMFNSSNRGYPDVSATGHSTYFAHY